LARPNEGVDYTSYYLKGPYQSRTSKYSRPLGPILTRPRYSSTKADKEVYKYKIAELTKTSNNLDDYAKYTFVIRKRINRRSEEVVLFIDIKSEGLRDILREVLYDIKAVSLIEDKLSVIEIVLLLRKLDRYTENIDSNSDYKSVYTEYLLLLIDYLKYALFKPGYYIYTIYISIKEPRYILNLEYRFLNYNGVKFGEAAKFRGLKPVESLKAFPLYYRLNYNIFFINKGKAIKVNINSRVVVDAIFFYKIQLNYSRLLLRDIRAKDKGRIVVFNISIILIEGYKREKGKLRGDSIDLPRSFDYLKIPLETKTILLLLAKTRLGIIPIVPFDDYIGKASILLRLPNLTYTSSLPGVGKTFTVKVTSEYFKLPSLFVFKIAKYFNTVLLLDKIKNIVTIVYALAKANVN
ncbi:hypothetical protein N7472_005611, partial [Penicillium cf. griseofulvum]